MHFQTRAMACAALLASSGAAHALTFNITFLPGLNAQAQQAFVDAGGRWSSVFSDNITLNMTVGAATLTPGTVAEATSTRISYSYATFSRALTADATSTSDATALASLSKGSAFGMLINRTSDNPNGSGSATPYVDMAAAANTTTIEITNANAKAIGLAPGAGLVGACTSACDASIQFNDTLSYDFDPNDGITAGRWDFVGVAVHELGHALGFVSGVDALDFYSTPPRGPLRADQFGVVSPLDLFRYSTWSAASGVIDFTADTRDKYLSLDGGVTAIGGLSTGRTYGDGQQASHWKGGPVIGIMKPNGATGETLFISAADLQAFDIIGWNLAAVPEPGTYALFGLGLAGLAARRCLSRPR